MNEDCVIYGIQYDKKKKTLVGTLFIAEPRELLVDVPYKEIFHAVRQRGLNVKDDGVVRDSLYEIIEKELLWAKVVETGLMTY